MFVPSAVSPPSANSSACTTSTIAMHSDPTHGPTRIATSAPPSRWPLAPGRIGKLIIWTAKTKAVTSPAIGAVRSSRSARARLAAIASPIAATSPNTAAVGAFTSPSLMCMATVSPGLPSPPTVPASTTARSSHPAGAPVRGDRTGSS